MEGNNYRKAIGKNYRFVYQTAREQNLKPYQTARKWPTKVLVDKSLKFTNLHTASHTKVLVSSAPNCTWFIGKPGRIFRAW